MFTSNQRSLHAFEFRTSWGEVKRIDLRIIQRHGPWWFSHPPLSVQSTASRRKNAIGPCSGPGSRWLTTIVRQVSYIQYLLACQNHNDLRPITLSTVPFPEVGFSAVAILGGGWLQSSASDALPWLLERRPPPRLIWVMWNGQAWRETAYHKMLQILPCPMPDL